ncbi:MAG TPA: beta-galactosidase [Chitinolyticbacter sp.]|nr:beta-galactosidase [Chitinolyticbacter sp.]
MPATLILVNGNHVPRVAWSEILAFLARGGGLVVLGDAPLLHPWPAESSQPEQLAYLRNLHIHEALVVANTGWQSLQASERLPWLGAHLACLPMSATRGFVLRPTTTKDHPADSGSAGPIDALIEPLVIATDTSGRPVAAPVVLIETLRGRFAGSRWIFINQRPDTAFWENGGAALLRACAAYTASGVTELRLQPDLACWLPGERPGLTLTAEQLSADRTARTWQLDLAIEHEGRPLIQLQRELAVDRYPQRIGLPLDFSVEPGFYAIRATLRCGDEQRLLRQGFWGLDGALLTRGERLGAGADYFERGGQSMPIVGMTYMAPTVHRKFLQLPNVADWEADFAELAAAGVNLIRTGIWTGWRQAMFIDGEPSEPLLRAIDAFLLTAARHGLEVTFTFFAFTPECWEGSNPYLDPRAIAAQKRLIAAIVRRHAASTHVHWDLINEPSMFDPKRVFEGPRSHGDAFEAAAFRSWLQHRHGDIALLAPLWDETTTKLADWPDIPPPEHSQIGLNTTEIAVKGHGSWLDYTLFSQAAFAGWATEMADFIRHLAPGAMVTVGQDEALGLQRPANAFFAEAIDYTNNHSWWLNDALLWDTLFAKVPGKPMLVQETGIMHVEAPTGRSKRSELELAHLLERKYAYAFAGGGAGAVQWIWQINYHMDNLNESHIGALRADGTHKPEAAVTWAFGAFCRKVGHLLRDRRQPSVAVVYPYSNDYGNRRFAVEATQRATRALAYELKQPFASIGEYQLDGLAALAPQLIILPSPHALSELAWAKLSDYVFHSGATLLVTGPLSLNEYWHPAARAPFGATLPANLAREERLDIAGTRYWLSFGGDKAARLAKEIVEAEPAARFMRKPLGSGTLLWCPLPAEMNDRVEPVAALYDHALHIAGITAPLLWHSGRQSGIYIEKQTMADGALWVLVSEAGEDEALDFTDHTSERRYRLTLPAGRALLFATDAAGELVAALNDHLIAVS